MGYETVTLAQEGSVGRLILNRPRTLNAWTSDGVPRPVILTRLGSGNAPAALNPQNLAASAGDYGCGRLRLARLCRQAADSG